MTWGKKCNPPLSPAEVTEPLNSLVNKQQRTATITSTTPEDNGDIDLLPLPAAPRWPVLHPDALYGLGGDLVALLGPNTEADSTGLLLTFLTCFGSAVGRDPYFPVEGDRHHGNLFVVLVGDSARGRKGTSLGRILSLFDTVDLHWKANCTSTGLSSGEGLIYAVRDPVEVTEAVKEKGKVVGYQQVIRDQGVIDKRLLINESEFAQTLKVMRREGNTLSPVIRQSWDSGNLTVLTKNNSARASDAHISILGHITRAELTKTLDDTDCLNGFANRFLWALVKRSKLLGEGGGDVDLGDFPKRLGLAVVKARTVGRMSRSPEARQLWLALYPILSGERQGLYGAVTGRAEAQTLRLSLLYALPDGEAVVGLSHLKAALALWNYCQDSAEIIFSDGQADPMEPLEKLLLEKVTEQPGVNRRGLHKAIGGRVPADMIVKALASLRDKGKVKAEVQATGGRPGECWFPVITTTPAIYTAAQPVVAESTPGVQQVPESPPPTSPTLTVVELLQAVSGIGGRIQRQGQRCVLLVEADRITPQIAAALEQRQEELLALLPETRPPMTEDEISEAQFLAELKAM